MTHQALAVRVAQHRRAQVGDERRAHHVVAREPILVDALAPERLPGAAGAPCLLNVTHAPRKAEWGSLAYLHFFDFNRGNASSRLSIAANASRFLRDG